MNNHAVYREELLEHYRHPQNFGKMKTADRQAHVLNPLCGDEILLQLAFDKKGKVKQVKFEGNGCALSIASSSLFTEFLKGKTRRQLNNIPPGVTEKLLDIKVGPARKKCVRLPHVALQKLLLNSPLKIRGARGVMKRGR